MTGSALSSTPPQPWDGLLSLTGLSSDMGCREIRYAGYWEKKKFFFFFFWQCVGSVGGARGPVLLSASWIHPALLSH